MAMVMVALLLLMPPLTTAVWPPALKQSFPSPPPSTVPIWVYDYGSSARTPPTASSDRVFIPTWDGLHALRARDGVLVWNRTWPGIGYETPPTLSPDGSTVYVISRDAESDGVEEQHGVPRQYYVKALQSSDGSPVWRSPLVGSSLGPSPGVSRDGITVYASVADVLYAFSAVTGARQWQVTLPGKSNIPPVASADGGMVYVVCDTPEFTPKDDKVLLGMRAANGDEVWRTITPHISADHPPVVTASSSGRRGGGGVYITAGFTEEDRGIYAYDATNGRKLWDYHDHPAEVLPSSLSPDGGFMYVAAGMAMGVTALQTSDGKALWTTDMHSLSAPSVTPDGARVYGGYPGSAFYALDASTGTVVQSCTGGDRRSQLWNLSPDGGMVYVMTLDYQLLAFPAEQCPRSGSTSIVPTAPTVHGGGGGQPSSDTNGGSTTSSSSSKREHMQQAGRIAGCVVAAVVLLCVMIVYHLRSLRSQSPPAATAPPPLVLNGGGDDDDGAVDEETAPAEAV